MSNLADRDKRYKATSHIRSLPDNVADLPVQNKRDCQAALGVAMLRISDREEMIDYLRDLKTVLMQKEMHVKPRGSTLYDFVSECINLHVEV